MAGALGNAIVSQLAALREKKGSIALEDLSAILESVASGTPSVDAFLRDEIRAIAGHIEVTRNEIKALAPEHTGTASAQLDAVLKTTEEAAHAILDAADDIQSILAGAAVDDATRASISQVTSRIYEACNFQDLTGQRIKKVIQALDFTETRIRRLTGLFTRDGSLDLGEFRKVAPETHPDAHLLNGPQLPGVAPSQDEIDLLFKSIK